MTPDHESLDSSHGHEYPVRELRVLLWDILCALVGISTRTPYCSTVCPCVSITHSLTLAGSPYHNHTRTAAGPGAYRLALPGRLSARPIRRFILHSGFFHRHSFHTAHSAFRAGGEQGAAECAPTLRSSSGRS